MDPAHVDKRALFIIFGLTQGATVSVLYVIKARYEELLDPKRSRATLSRLSCDQGYHHSKQEGAGGDLLDRRLLDGRSILRQTLALRIVAMTTIAVLQLDVCAILVWPFLDKISYLDRGRSRNEPVTHDDVTISPAELTAQRSSAVRLFFGNWGWGRERCPSAK